MDRRVLVILLLVIVFGGLLFYSQWQSATLKVSGFIEADQIRVGSRVGGRVAAVHVVEGQHVTKGQLLIELEPFDLLARRVEAEQMLAAKRSDWERLNTGYLPEEIGQARAHAAMLEARLKKLKAGPRKQEIESARAQVRLAEAEVQLAQARFKRIRALAENDATAREDFDRISTELLTAQQRLAVRQDDLALLLEGTRREEIEEAEAQVEEAQQALALLTRGYRDEAKAEARAAMEAAQATLDAIDRQIEELQIKSPVDGEIEALDLQPGDLVPINAPAVSLVDAKTLWVRAYVPENRLALQVGQELPLSVDSYPGVRFPGKLTFVAREAEFTPGNVQTPEERSKQVFRIKVTLLSGHDRLRPGMAADVWLGDMEGPHATADRD